MREPSFWWGEASLASGVLAPLAAIYGAVAQGRLGGRGRRAGAPVVCIGNLTVGGAGKTPTALAVARMLAAAGERPVFLSRGYGGGAVGAPFLGPPPPPPRRGGGGAPLPGRAAPPPPGRPPRPGAGG